MLALILLSQLTFSDYVCWANSNKDDNCGTFGYSKNQEVANQHALKLCYDVCSSDCHIAYCDQPSSLKKVKKGR